MMKGLYFHIPFCKSRCPYCDFHTSLFKCETAEKYVAALIDEIKTGIRTKEFIEKTDLSFDTVYFGGGTPSVLNPDQIGCILNTAREHYNLSPNAEITLECNPSTVDADYFKRVAAFGVNRISLGLQSANDTERRVLGRIANGDKVKFAIESAKSSGITNISLDVMLGVPEQTTESLDETINFCINADVPHISAYMLSIEDGTVFAKKQAKLKLPNEDTVCDMYEHFTKRLISAGLEHYEISNFAKNGFESKHNLKYWNCEEYLGLGAAAHSFINNKRFYFERDTDGFINGSNAVFDSFGGDEEEFIMLKLRLKKGLLNEEYKSRFGKNIPQKYLKNVEKFSKSGYIIITADGFSLTDRGMLISNYIIANIVD